MKKSLKKLLSVLLLLCLLLTAAAATAEENKDLLVTAITLSETELNVQNRSTVKVNVHVEPVNAKNRKLEWTSSDEAVATVKNGSIRGTGNGTCTITCKATDGSGVEATCKVTVSTIIRNMKIDRGAKMELPVDTTVKLTPVITPEDASIKDVTWETSNDKIVTVDEEGNVTAHKVGTAKVTAYATDGSKKKASITIKVDKYDLVFFDTKPKTATYEYGSGMYTIKWKSKKGRVKVTGIDKGGMLVLIGNSRNSDTCTVTPLKPGTDMIVITAGRVTNRIRVFISPDAFKEKE